MHRKRYIFIILLLSCITGSSAQDSDFPFAGNIRTFIESDRLNPPPQKAVLFIGSSSFTMWYDMHDYFPGFSVVNRGFGGSTLTDQIRYADEIIFPYSPRQVVIYCGENDIASADSITPEIVHGRFMTLFNMIRDELPGVRIIYVSMKPSPSRWHMAGRITEANELISKFLETMPNAGYVNIWDSMLNQDHLPDSSLFLTDMLHMNSKGYDIWQKRIEPELITTADREMDAFIGDLMKRMTIDEKVGQLIFGYQ